MSQNTLTSDHQLIDLLNLHKQEIFLGLNCHAIGTIQSFNATNQSCSATINYQKTYIVAGPNGTQVQQMVNYPTLVECPLIVISGGQGALTMPVQQGDSCLILFNDRDMDLWITSDQVVPPNTNRLHSFTDAIVLVGLSSFQNPQQNYDTSRVVLSFEDTKIALGALINIQNNSQNLATLLQNLISTIQGLTIAVNTAALTAGGNPVLGVATGTVSAGSQSSLASLASDLGELLE